MPDERQLDARDLTGRHLGGRAYIRRLERGEVLSGRLAAVEHRVLPDRPVGPTTDVTIRWYPDVYFRVALHPGEPVVVIPPE